MIVFCIYSIRYTTANIKIQTIVFPFPNVPSIYIQDNLFLYYRQFGYAVSSLVWLDKINIFFKLTDVMCIAIDANDSN